MKKHTLLIISLLTIGLATAVALWPLMAKNIAPIAVTGLVVDNANANTGVPIPAGDTAVFGYPLTSTTTEISKAVYDLQSGGKPAIGRTLFYYTDTTTATDGTKTVKYYRYEVNYVYMTVGQEGDSYTIAASTTPTDSTCLWRVVQTAGDGANQRRYQNLKTGKWVRTEVNTANTTSTGATGGTVTITLVDDENNSSAIDHQWTTVLDYDKDHRTFAYPLVTSGATEYFLYFDKTNNRWAYTTDATVANVNPAYYEKWSERQNEERIELFDWYYPGMNYFTFVKTAEEAAAQNAFVLSLTPTLKTLSYFYSVAGESEGYDTDYLYGKYESQEGWQALSAKGYSYSFDGLTGQGGATQTVYTTAKSITGSGIYNQPAYNGTAYHDAARTLLSATCTEKIETDFDGNAYTYLAITVKPEGKSPLNQVSAQAASQKDSVVWADYVDTVAIRFLKNGALVERYAMEVTRESYHYYENEKVVPYISIGNETDGYKQATSYDFPAAGGTVRVRYDSLVVEHTIGLYDFQRNEMSESAIGRETLVAGSQDCLDRVSHTANLDDEKSGWLTVSGKDAEIDQGGTWVELTAAGNDGNLARSNRLVQSFTYKKTNWVYSMVIFLNQQSRTSAGKVKFAPQAGMGYANIDADGRQSVHTHETTIYYYPGQVFELRPRERNFLSWQRWYDYATGAEPRFYRSRKDNSMNLQSDFWKRPPLKNVNNNLSEWWRYDSINNDALTSQGLYYAMIPTGWMWDGPDKDAKLSETEASLSNMLVPIVIGWDTTGNDLPAERDIAVDLSNYADYTLTDTLIEEPTISYRQIYHLRPASQMADSLAKFTATRGEYFENYLLTAPINKEVLIQTEYASAYPYNDNATMARPSDLCYFIPVQINTKGTPRDTVLRLTMSDNLDKVEVQFYKDGELQTAAMQTADGTAYKNARHVLGSYYDYRTIKSAVADTVVYEYRIVAPTENNYGGSFGETIWNKYNGIRVLNGNGTTNQDILLARWEVRFVPQSLYGPSTTTLMTEEKVARDFVLLAKKDFNYNKPGTTNCVIYPAPLGAEESSFGYCYPYSKSQGKSHRGTAVASGEGDRVPFPYYGEYAIVNCVGRPTEQGQYSFWGYEMEQRGGAENGYCLYVDGSQLPGKVVTLSTDATICSGQQLYCSAWVARANKDDDSPILQFDIEGRNSGGKWESIGAFCTGPLDNGGQWNQVNFPIVGSQNYTETRISVYNYASSNDGNDFVLDDIMLYASPVPIESFQATTSCNRNALGDQIVTIIKADYTQFTGINKYEKDLFYDIYETSTGKVVKTNYYQGDHSAEAEYGYLTTPAENFTPKDGEVVGSLSELVELMNSFSRDTTCLRYIRNYETGKERWVLYLAQLVHESPLAAKKTYEVRTAYSQDDLSKAECAMRTKLPVFEKTAFIFNGETYPAAGQCANGLYPLEILVTDKIIDGDKEVDLNAYAEGDWLTGIEGDDPWYYSYLDEDQAEYHEMDSVTKAKCDSAFKQAYGYSRTIVDAAIKDLRRDTTGNKKSNYPATDISEVNGNIEYWDDQSHYEVIKNLVAQNKLTLWKERQHIYMRSQDTCRYWIYPIAGTAKTEYNGNTYILNQCANPTYIMVFSVESQYSLNLSRLATKDIDNNEVPRVRVSESQANGVFAVPITEIGSDVVICYDSTQVVLSTDPVVSPLIGSGSLSMHYTQNMFLGHNSQKYYQSGDTLFFRPIDEHHVDSMKTIQRTESGWTIGHPGLWITNTHRMRAGYEYTLRLQMMTKTTNAMSDPNNTGCLVGYAYINVVVVPDTLVWTPTAMTDDSVYLWSDDRNWRGVVDGQTMSWGYTPLQSTMAILPECGVGCDEMKYPTIVPDVESNLLYPQDVHYHTNVCKKVQFRSGAKMLGQENLKYDQAYVDATLPANGWYTVASPLRATYSGDLFVPHTGKYGSGSSLESSEDFVVSGFKGSRDSTAAYAVWASYYNKDVENVHDYGKETVVSKTAHFTESNSMGMEIEPGQGLAVAGFGPADDTKVLNIRLPKPDAEYDYYTSGGEPTGLQEKIDRTYAYQLGFVPDEGQEYMTIRLSIKNQKTDGTGTPIQGQQGFLFGNPTMAYIDMVRFLSANTDVLSPSGYQIQVDGAWKSVTGNVQGTEHYLKPMQSAMVLSKDASGTVREIEVKLYPSCLSLVPRDRNSATTVAETDEGTTVAETDEGTTVAEAEGTAEAAEGAEKSGAEAAKGKKIYSKNVSGSAKGRKLTPERMNITVVSGGEDAYGNPLYQKGEAQLQLSEFTSTGYDAAEDIPFISSGVEYGRKESTSTTPVNIYTIAGNTLLAADLRPEMSIVPLGFVLHPDYRSDSLTLFFQTNRAWSEECYLCDSYTGEKRRIYNDSRFRIATPADHEIRYYLQGEAYDPDPTPTDNEDARVEPNGSARIDVFSNEAERIVVVASSDIAEVRVYDVAGRLVTQVKPAAATAVCTLTAPKGVAMVEVRLRNEQTGHGKVMVW